MDFRLFFLSLSAITLSSLAAPADRDFGRLSQRDIPQFLEETAKTAKLFGQKAIKYLIPNTQKSGIAVLKPFLRKRSTKRSALPHKQSAIYPMPANNLYNANVRSVIGYPVANGNNYANSYNWNMNQYNNGNTAFQRSVIPGFTPQQYQQWSQYASINNEKRTLDDKKDKVSSEADTKASLKDFHDLVTGVDSALLSYTDQGVALNEKLKGPNAGSKKREKIEDAKK
ncbi:uncharacterized protein LOC135695723 [Rhopilema esculentum]|uniref:uncharacterized protein LOC135695723 n=1 Tax=Rhopilema esculentum TaxID=499914 RepID=UPI0031E044DC